MVAPSTAGGQRWRNTSRWRVNIFKYRRQKWADVYISPKYTRQLQDALTKAECSFFKTRDHGTDVVCQAMPLSHWVLQEHFRRCCEKSTVALQNATEHLMETANVGIVFRPIHPDVYLVFETTRGLKFTLWWVEWVQQAYLEMADASFDPADIRKRLQNPEEGKCVREDGVMICQDTAHKYWQTHQATTDAQSLHDALCHCSLLMANCCAMVSA